MARIVLCAGSSHTPLLTLPVEQWTHRASVDYANPRLNLSDGRLLTYDELKAEFGEPHTSGVSTEALRLKADVCQRALDRLADELQAAAPDVVVIVGDDQEELFSTVNQPAIAVFYGDEVITYGKYGADSPDWMQTMGRGYMMDEAHTLPGAPELALHVIKGLLEHHIDVAAAARVEAHRKTGFGHAYGFIVRRLFKGRPIPVLPVLLNTYYPPNVPSAARCYEIGEALRRAIEASPLDLRVAIIASGGLSHFVVDEALDRRVLAGFAPGQSDILRSLPREALNSGSSEILNWILAAGAVDATPLSWSEYVPLYRTPAGTGIGAAFAVWQNVDETGAAR